MEREVSLCRRLVAASMACNLTVAGPSNRFPGNIHKIFPLPVDPVDGHAGSHGFTDEPGRASTATNCREGPHDFDLASLIPANLEVVGKNTAN
jgi:hypothetical protein